MSDLRRVYVVEAKDDKSPSGWWTVHQTDDQDEAVRVCEDESAKRGVNCRVRQFWVESFAPEQRPLRPGESAPVEATLHDVVCLDHRDQTLRVYDLAVSVRCPTCRKAMVPMSMAKAMDQEDIVDLTKGVP